MRWVMAERGDHGRQIPLSISGADMKQRTNPRRVLMGAFASALLGAAIAVPTAALADEGGVSFWIPGFFGSLAAAPLQPGWTLQTNYYHTSVSAGRSEEHTSELQSHHDLVCRLLLEKKKKE